MVEFIDEVIRRFGGRVAGTETERKAQEYAGVVLKPFCDRVEHHRFRSALKAKFHSLKGFVITYMIALALFKWNVHAAALVGLVNSILFFGHFLNYRDWLDFLYKQHESENVIGSIEPSGPVRSTLIVSGHMDSVVEFQWWYRLGHIGGILTTVSGFLLFTQGFVYLAAGIFYAAMGRVPVLFEVLWWIHLVLSPVLITFFTIHGDRKVDGALDNLTGVALAVEMAKVFGGGAERLKHTRLKVISFGSEETGLRGSRNYVKDHLVELKAENAAVVNIDTIRSDEYLSVVKGELNTFVRYPEYMVERMSKAFSEESVPFLKVNLPIGATDGTAFAYRDIPAVSIVGLTTKKFDPTYHTRLDRLENLDPKGLEAMRKVLIRFVRNWDAETSKSGD